MNINLNTKERGFTIVELLIVIVVIGILAAISIVAYNGVQNRAKTSSGQSQANSIVKKFEALNAVKGAYYSTATGTGVTGALLNTYANAAPVANEAVVDTPANVIGATSATVSGLSTANANNGNTVATWTCGVGANVWYLDYATTTQVVLKAGNGC